MKDKDGVNFVTDDNSGGYFVCECHECGAVFSSGNSDGCESIGDSGDYGDMLCPSCGEVDPKDCDNANRVWNVQQSKINALVGALELYEKAFDDLFSSCLSNGVFNAWGEPVNCTNLNQAHCDASSALKKAKAKFTFK